MIKRYFPHRDDDEMLLGVKGEYVTFKDYLKVVEELEYDLRFYREEVDNCEETIRDLVDEVHHWRDLYNELYEQDGI